MPRKANAISAAALHVFVAAASPDVAFRQRGALPLNASDSPISAPRTHHSLRFALRQHASNDAETCLSLTMYMKAYFHMPFLLFYAISSLNGNMRRILLFLCPPPRSMFYEPVTTQRTALSQGPGRYPFSQKFVRCGQISIFCERLRPAGFKDLAPITDAACYTKDLQSFLPATSNLVFSCPSLKSF